MRVAGIIRQALGHGLWSLFVFASQAIKGGLGLFNVVDDKIVRLNVDDNDFWDYPLPQGEIKFNAQKHYHIEFD